MSLAIAITSAVLVLIVHGAAVALARSLRTYSRSRLEEVCRKRGRPERADRIAHYDDRAERGTEALEVITALALAGLLGWAADRSGGRSTGTSLTLIFSGLAIGGLAHVAAGVLGRAYAESLLDAAWPVADAIRRLMAPVVTVARWAEDLIYGIARRSDPGPRPASVEVEIPVNDEERQDVETVVPEATREMLENVLALADATVADVMRPRASLVTLPDSVSARDAARSFADTGFSRIPLYGESRDDIVGILYAKDLLAALAQAEDPATVAPRALARTALLVPETKHVDVLLRELRDHRVQMALVVDEYGSIAGLVTLEDLLEQIVGPIEDEFDKPPPDDPIRRLDPGHYEVDAALPIEELNERLGLHLPTDEDFQTVGGLAFTALGRVPEPGASFRVNGLAFTVLAVDGRTIRLLSLDLEPPPAAPEEARTSAVRGPHLDDLS